MGANPEAPGKPAVPYNKGRSPATGLTERQQLFLDAYLQSSNGIQAYQSAYPNASLAVARTESHRLLATPKIALLIQEAQRRGETAAQRALEATMLRHEDTTQRIALELRRIAYVDTAAVAMKRPDELNEDERRAIKAVEVTERKDASGNVTERRYRYVFYDKLTALRLLGITLGMWVDAPPPPPPVAADAARNAGADDSNALEARRRRARREIMKALADLAQPAPLIIDGDAAPAPESWPDRGNGKPN